MGRLEILGLSGAYMAVRRARARRSRGGFLVYGLSLAIYCTSWTFFGAVGTAARTEWDYLPIYIGPTLGITLLFPVWRRIAFAAKRENTGSIADFLSARYGKSRAVSAVVAGVAIIGALPYIALQLRSLTMAVGLLSGGVVGSGAITFILAAVLAGFAMLFGARRRI